jgi:hypothetical protein
VRGGAPEKRRGQTSLLLRVVSGHVPGGRLEAVRRSLEHDYVPAAVAMAGLERFLVGTWPEGDAGGHAIAFMTVWRDVESASTAFSGDLTALRLLDGIEHGEVLDHVDYYDVDLLEARRNPGTPRYLRLTAGTVGRGLDADIQRELRTRLRDLGHDVVDAYVGRRVQGQSVEIAFVSAWTDTADVPTLEQPVWPDISAQYDRFWIRLFDVLLEGSPGR